ncbi:hypothetical protein J2W59_001304 [Pseudomonas fluorescens]|nr:hypothetical protein [Pseudomonas fluorescens]
MQSMQLQAPVPTCPSRFNQAVPAVQFNDIALSDNRPVPTYSAQDFGMPALARRGCPNRHL